MRVGAEAKIRTRLMIRKYDSTHGSQMHHYIQLIYLVQPRIGWPRGTSAIITTAGGIGSERVPIEHQLKPQGGSIIGLENPHREQPFLSG